MTDTTALTCLILLTALTGPSEAHNGAIARAQPVVDIIVDGDLDDWPADAISQRIHLTEYGQEPSDDDLSASFRLGYSMDEESLFLAVEVQDESVVIDSTSNVFWNLNDGCELFVDVGHGSAGTPIQHYVYGVRTSVPLQQESAVEVRWQHAEGRHTYEWRVDLGAARNRSIGLDVVVTDKDEDGSFSWMTWGKGMLKLTDNQWLGDVIVADSGPVGEVRGSVIREGTNRSVAGRRILLQSVDHPHLAVIDETDEGGFFALQLPEGEYRASATTTLGGSDLNATVSPETPVDLHFAVPAVRGESVVANAGLIVDAGDGFRAGVWHSLGVADGLPGNWVRAFQQDRQGYLWIGTEAGLSRFDGRYLLSLDHTHGLISDEVRCMAEDSTGALWIGTDRGLSRYDGNLFTNFSTADGLPSDQIRGLAVDESNQLWIATDGGLARYDGWEFTTFSMREGMPGNQVRSVIVDRRGELWMGIWGRGLCRFDGETFTLYTTEDGLADSHVRPVLEDRSGNIWFGTEAGVSRYDGHGFVNFATEDGLPAGEVWALHEDLSGKIWAGVFGGGASVYDGHGFVTYTVRDGLPSDVVLGFGEDREGVVWVGSDGGASRSDERFATISTREGLPAGAVTAVVQDHDDNLWFGVGSRRTGGLSRYDGEQLTTLTAVNGLSDNEVWSIAEDRVGALWIGTARGVSRIEEGSLVDLPLEPDLLPYPVSCFAEEADGAMWLGSWGGGLSRYVDGKYSRFTTDDGLAHDRIYSCEFDRNGHLWLSTWGGGVSRFDGERFANYTTADGLASDSVWVALQDDGGVWFGTHEGLSYFDGERFSSYTVDEGLASNRVRALMKDDDGHLWVGTDSGVNRFDGKIFQTLLRRDGLVSNSIGEFFQDSDGDIWIGTSAGLTRYRPSHTPPPVVLTDIITDEGRHGPVGSVELTTTQDFIAFEFTGISFKTRPEAMGYRYHLEGHNESWQSTHTGRAEYLDLPRGDYTFEVLAVDRDLSYSQMPATAYISVRLPGSRIAMWSVLAVAIGLVVWQAGLIIRRNRSLRRARDELEHRVEERTRELRETQGQMVMQEKMASLGSLAAGIAHEINNPVGAVSSAADTSNRCLARLMEFLGSSDHELLENESFQKVLTTLEHNNRVSLTGTERIGEIVKSLRNFARLDEADLQETDLHEGLDSTLTLLHHELRDSVEVIKDYGNLPLVCCYPQVLNQVFMNLLSNAVHALGGERGQIRIETRANDEEVHISIADTGYGISSEHLSRVFDPGFTTKGVGVGTGLGLSISYNIIERHRGEIRVESERGNGARFTVSLPRDLREQLVAEANERNRPAS